MADPNGPDPEEDPSAPIDNYTIVLFLIAILISGYVFLSNKIKAKRV